MSKNDKVGLVHFGLQQPSVMFLAKQLERAGYDVINLEPADVLAQEVDDIKLVVNIHSNQNDDEVGQLLDYLAENDADIIINDTLISNELVGWNKNRWIRHLLHKIDSKNNILPESRTSDTVDEKQLNLNALGIKKIWILAASIGGPESLVRFLKSFDGSEPLLFVIVQHMDSEFVHMMENQLNKNGQIPVQVPQIGEMIKPGHAILMPVDESLVIESDGTIGVKDFNPNRLTTPCIDDACMDMIDQLKQLNMAVFSGMASDGVKGAINIHENGGIVITQSEESCVVSAIAEEVRQKNYSQFDGDPEAMAKYIKQNL
ncbi:chemotaxis protein CheB [Marinicella rhabdoformis]|uniref:chemotaxis protein CheB n=1 Tax=Marinicella rhabdoformis TaxID=2580566 RepID=UPI0012AED3BF|nr:chemotaxis protein CheB [Marinicella rhabdoformis]